MELRCIRGNLLNVVVRELAKRRLLNALSPQRCRLSLEHDGRFNKTKK